MESIVFLASAAMSGTPVNCAGCVARELLRCKNETFRQRSTGAIPAQAANCRDGPNSRQRQCRQMCHRLPPRHPGQVVDRVMRCQGSKRSYLLGGQFVGHCWRHARSERCLRQKVKWTKYSPSAASWLSHRVLRQKVSWPIPGPHRMRHGLYF